MFGPIRCQLQCKDKSSANITTFEPISVEYLPDVVEGTLLLVVGLVGLVLLGHLPTNQMSVLQCVDQSEVSITDTTTWHLAAPDRGIWMWN